MEGLLPIFFLIKHKSDYNYIVIHRSANFLSLEKNPTVD